MSKNILIIGGAGYIGSTAVEKLVSDNHNVTVIDDLSTGQLDKVNSKAVFKQINILNINDLEEVFINGNFDTVIHFAAKKSVSESEENPDLYFRNNVTGTLNILSMMNKYRVPKIIFSSTAAVYKPKDEENAIYDESSQVEPINIYGKSKLICEQLIQEYFRVGKIKEYIIFRYFNVAGNSSIKYIEENAQNVFPLIIKSIKNNTEFKIFGNDYNTKDGTCIRDYIHLEDLVDAHIVAVNVENKSGIYNLGTNTGYSVMDLIETFENILNIKMNIKIDSRRKGDPAVVIADASKSKTDLNWSTKRDLKDMIMSMLKAYDIIG